MAAAALMVTSTAVGMAGAQNQAAGMAAASSYNAAVKQMQADAAIRQAQENERRTRIQGRMAIGGIRAGIGASGIQTEGSALDVLESSAANAELDALTVRHQGEMQAWAYRAGANLDLLNADNAKSAGNFAAAGYLLKGMSGGAGSSGGGGGGGLGSDGGGSTASAGGGDMSAAAALA